MLNNYASTVQSLVLAWASKRIAYCSMFWPFLTQTLFKGSFKAIFTYKFQLEYWFPNYSSRSNWKEF
jgi:hypothetical protein